MSAAVCRPQPFLGRSYRLRAVALVAVATLLALLMPLITGTGLSAAFADSTTVTGTASGDHAWDPGTGAQSSQVPSATVDQTDNLTDQIVHVTWRNFTPSTDQNGAAHSEFSPGNTYYAVTVVECRGTNPVNDYYVGNYPGYLAGADCYAYGAGDPNASNGVGNEVTTFTGADGSGEAYLHVETAQENNFLGCDATHPCSIVVLPTWGGIQPDYAPVGDPSVNCADHSQDLTGQTQSGLWALDPSLGEACSWSDRIVIPLHFATTPNDCPSKSFAFAAQGAPMLSRAMSQWQAGWCAGSGALTFDYDSGTNEYLARQSFLSGGSGALTSATDVALVDRPADPSAATNRKFTYAPVANSGIAIAYHIDDPRTGKLITNLTLNARLMAKLLTQSYALADYSCLNNTPDPTKQGPNCDPATRGNPASIIADPEFQQLNPQLTPADFPNGSDAEFPLGSFLPLVASGNSDLTHELTRWIADDPDAAAFLAGQPDNWGMHVNSYYRGISYPIDQFQVLDPGYTNPALFPGNGTTQVSWNPISGLANVAASLVIDRPSAQDSSPNCVTNSQGQNVNCVYGRLAPIQLGRRGMFAVVGLNDAAADEFPTAKLVNAGGQAVAPSTVSLSTAVSEMKTNPDKITQYVDHANRDPQAYPLTMTDYAMVPTCGLSQAKATAITSFIDHVANSQLYGTGPGSLAPGDLALTASQLAETHAAELAVGTQSCTNPVSVTSHGGAPVVHNPASNPAGGSTGSAGSSSTGNPAAGGAAAPAGSGSAGSPAKGSAPASASTPSITPQAFGIKHPDSAGPVGNLLPLLLILAALLIIGGPFSYLFATTAAGPAAARFARQVLRR